MYITTTVTSESTASPTDDDYTAPDADVFDNVVEEETTAKHVENKANECQIPLYLSEHEKSKWVTLSTDRFKSMMSCINLIVFMVSTICFFHFYRKVFSYTSPERKDVKIYFNFHTSAFLGYIFFRVYSVRTSIKLALGAVFKLEKSDNFFVIVGIILRTVLLYCTHKKIDTTLHVTLNALTHGGLFVSVIKQNPINGLPIPILSLFTAMFSIYFSIYFL